MLYIEIGFVCCILKIVILIFNNLEISLWSFYKKYMGVPFIGRAGCRGDCGSV
jgi:hypothetical protein